MGRSLADERKRRKAAAGAANGDGRLAASANKIFRAELLAPAGSLESVKAAVNAGADAVYMGGRRFGARAYAKSASDVETDEVMEAIAYCHLHGVKLYMTVNTLFKDDELKELFSYLLPYYEAGVDAVIVQDAGAAACIRRLFPDLEMHASTQVTITGTNGARLALEMGFSRVVLARELTLEEIAAVYRETGAEIEAFVHGALCYSYSGACFMSSLLGGRSGNRGRCAGTCRLCYESGGKKGYFLSMKDMYTLDRLPEMLRAGVYSMKIEGRMKSPLYTAGVVSVYRKYLDMAVCGKEYRVAPADLKLLSELFDRGGTTSYLNRHNGRDMIAVEEKRFRAVDTAAVQAVRQTYIEKEKEIFLEAQVRLREGEPVALTLRETRQNGADLLKAALPAAEERTENEPVSVTVLSEQRMEKASGRPATAADVEKQIRKTGGTCYVMQRISVDMEGELFVPVKVLNELRRSALEAFREKKLAVSQRVYKCAETGMADSCASGDGTEASVSEVVQMKKQENPEIRVCVERAEQLDAALASARTALIYLDEAGFSDNELMEALARCHAAGKRVGLRLRRILTETEELREGAQAGTKLLEKLICAGLDAVLVRAFEQLLPVRGILKNCKESAKHFEVVFDYTVYGYNHDAAAFLHTLGAERLTAPIELNYGELRQLCAGSVVPYELMVYGHLPMMVSANCVLKTVSGCTHKNEITGLKDRMGKTMPVRCYCKYCYNEIYNADPLVLYDLRKELNVLAPASVRYDFSVESAAQTAAVLDGTWNAAQLTRGHFRRGIE